MAFPEFYTSDHFKRGVVSLHDLLAFTRTINLYVILSGIRIMTLCRKAKLFNLLIMNGFGEVAEVFASF